MKEPYSSLDDVNEAATEIFQSLVKDVLGNEGGRFQQQNGCDDRDQLRKNIRSSSLLTEQYTETLISCCERKFYGMGA